MASFLDMDLKQRRMYVARMLNLDPHSPDSWPLETIDRVIGRAEKAADESVQRDVIRLMSHR